MELIVNGFDYFRKNPIITLRLGSKYASVIINLILTSATQLHSKITKINEIFIVTSHFYLKLRNLEKKSVNLPEVLFDCTQRQIDVKRYPKPCKVLKKELFSPSTLSGKIRWGQCCSALVTWPKNYKVFYFGSFTEFDLM